MTTEQNGKFGRWLKTSITARMLMIGILILLLLIPISYINTLITERNQRQQSVVHDISDKWGSEVLLYGPILKIPYRTYQIENIYDPITKQSRKKSISSTHYAYFFPNDLDIKATINPQEKRRGIYKTAVYESRIHIKGTFTPPDFSDKDVKENDIEWHKARLLMETSNLKGVTNLVEIKLNANKYPLESRYTSTTHNEFRAQEVHMHQLESKYMTKEDVPATKSKSFELALQINGSQQIRFVPIGKKTTVRMTSNWKTANFVGEYLPFNEDKIKDNGFDAQWKILDMNRPFSQEAFKELPNLNFYAFGVNFMIPVDEYQKSERSVKYGFLVISLTFLIFFLLQTMSTISIHPFQYLMIGIALTMFYTLLISISEHSTFLKAYIIAGISVVTLISLYSKSILKNTKFPLFIALSLSLLYSFIFVIIQLESYALLVGCVGLFIILAIVMYASRKIDWDR